MARKPRLHLPGGFYHVILRGNGGAAIFVSDRDRLRFCDLLEEGTGRYGHRVHGFCLMPNHAHLLVQVGETTLSKVVQNLTFRYAMWMNRKHQRRGHLFQGRYKAVLVDSDAYLTQLVRYVHTNPVRAGMVADPQLYRWSSHRTYLGERVYTWVTTAEVLGIFSNRVGPARRLYERFVSEGLGEVRWPPYACGGVTDVRILGGGGFAARVLDALGQRAEKPVRLEDLVCRVSSAYHMSGGQLCSRSQSKPMAEARAVLALLVRDSWGQSLVALARLLNRDASTLSSAACRLERRARADEDLARRVRAGRKILRQLAGLQA